MKKIAIICSPGMDNHLGEVADYLKDNYEIKILLSNDREMIFNILKWADAVWIEWADSNAIHVTRFESLLYQKQVILRIHSYEAFTEYLKYIKWSTITDLIFVAEHIKDIVLKKYPKIVNNVDRIHVIPNGIDTERFEMSRELGGKDLAYLGFINFKKGPLLLFTVFAELLKLDSQYKLHIGGEFQEERYKLYLDQMSLKNPLIGKQVIFHDWVKPEEWLRNKSHIICSSVLESQGKGIMEAMSMGLKPIIHDFVGAEDIYPSQYLWSTASEFCEMILSDEYNPLEYRNYIVDNYETSKQVAKIKNIIEEREKPVSVFLPDGPVKPVTLSVVMIMKDEEKHIGRCLNSIKDIADEIIIVDTGSTDKSVEIAESFGAKIYHHPWEENFSLHRNQAIGYATCDWLLQIDADEELTGDKDGLKKCLSKLSPEYNGVSICQKSGSQFNALRIFRNGKVKYRRAVHNIAIYEGVGKFGSVLFEGVILIHYGSFNQISKEDSEKKFKRTKGLLRKSLEADPYDYELYFYLVQLYGTFDRYDEAIKYAEMYLGKRDVVDGFNDSIYYTIIRLYIELKNYEKANYWLKEAQIVLPVDLDIAFVMTELGAVTGNGPMMLEGARNYLRRYKVFDERPDAKGGRFIFSLKSDCLYFVLKHMTSYLLADGVDCLGKLKDVVGILPESNRGIAAEEIRQILEPIGVSTN